MYLPKSVSTICVYCDSQLGLEREQSNMCNGKFRYIHHIHNIVNHLLLNKNISINYVKSKKNIMDLLTKGLLGELMYN